MLMFVAIPISKSIHANLVAMQERLKAADATIRWVEVESFYLTVKFLGHMSEERLPEVEAICAKMANVPPFTLNIRGAGSMPKYGNPRTLWAGVAEGVEAWKKMVRGCDNDFAALGVPREGGLGAYITLGRVRGLRGVVALREAIRADAATDCGSQHVDRIHLMQSILSPEGASYYKLRSWKLSGSNAGNV